jgi:hypothetical protein
MTATIDGDENPYLQERALKIQRNQERMKALGLEETKKNLKRAVTPSKPKKRFKVDSPTSVISPARRSSRVSKKPVEFTFEDLPDERGYVTVRVRKLDKDVTYKAPKKRRVDFENQISDEERAQFDDIPASEWTDDMKLFLEQVLKNSPPNVSSVMKQTMKLIKGQGIQHPATGAFFMKNQKIHLGMDFREISNEAVNWVWENGGDRSNGWLGEFIMFFKGKSDVIVFLDDVNTVYLESSNTIVQHPVKKIWLYQQARAENKKAFFTTLDKTE